MKELQISPAIDPHDLAVKRDHAIEFLCDDLKVRVKLRFRGRQKAHKEIGFEVVNQVRQRSRSLWPCGFAAQDVGRPRPQCRPYSVTPRQARQEPAPGSAARAAPSPCCSFAVGQVSARTPDSSILPITTELLRSSCRHLERGYSRAIMDRQCPSLSLGSANGLAPGR